MAVVVFAAIATLTCLAVSTNPDRKWASLPLALILTMLAAIDLEKMRLPDVLTLPMIAAGVIFQNIADPSVGVLESVLGAVLGYASFRTIAYYFLRVRKKHGLGLGDVKLFAGLGAWAGATMLPVIALIAAIAGLVQAGASAVFFNRADPRVRFGPALCFGFWVVWCLNYQFAAV